MQRFDCPHCGKRLKFGAEHAGKSVKCPKCTQGIYIPPDPATQQAAAQAVPQLPPTPPPSAPVAGDEFQTAFVLPWSASVLPPAQPVPPVLRFDYDNPPSPPASFHNEPLSLDDDYDSHDRRGGRRGPRWLEAFGAGCGLVKWGMWVNFASSAYLILIFEISLLGVATKSSKLVVADTLGLYVPVFLFQLAGTGMMLFGWMRMIAVPPNSGAGGLMTGATALAGLRELVLFVGMVFFILAVTAKGFDGLRDLLNAQTAMMIAYFCVWVATFSVIPGMAIVGGEIPSRRLRQKAGQVTLVHQILAIVLLMLIAAAYFLVSAVDLLPTGGAGRGGDGFEAPRTSRGGERGTRDVERDPTPILMLLLLVVLTIEAAYTYLHYSLYSVGQQAAQRGADTR